MSEFKGNVPEIEIKKSEGGLFTYYCKKGNKRIGYPCRIHVNNNDDCYSCLGFNLKFERLYFLKSKCISCGMKLSFGYFMMIYLLEKAGLLPKKFRMLCCICRRKNIKNLTEN